MRWSLVHMYAINDELCRWFITDEQTHQTVVSAAHWDADAAHYTVQWDVVSSVSGETYQPSDARWSGQIVQETQPAGSPPSLLYACGLTLIIEPAAWLVTPGCFQLVDQLAAESWEWRIIAYIRPPVDWKSLSSVFQAGPSVSRGLSTLIVVARRLATRDSLTATDATPARKFSVAARRGAAPPAPSRKTAITLRIARYIYSCVMPRSYRPRIRPPAMLFTV